MATKHELKEREDALVKAFEDLYTERLEKKAADVDRWTAEGDENQTRYARSRRDQLLEECGAEVAVWELVSRFRATLTEAQVRSTVERLVKAGLVVVSDQRGNQRYYMLASASAAQDRKREAKQDAKARAEHGGTSETLRAAALVELDEALKRLEALRERVAALPDRSVARLLYSVRHETKELVDTFGPEGDR